MEHSRTPTDLLSLSVLLSRGEEVMTFFLHLSWLDRLTAFYVIKISGLRDIQS